MLRKAVLITSAGFLTAILVASVSEGVFGARETAQQLSPAVSESHLQPLARVAASTKKKRTFPAPYLASVTQKSSLSSVSSKPTLAFLDQPSITPHHKELATAVFMALPAGCRDNIRTFSILYKDAKYRGLGGKTTIIIDGSVNDTEFIALLAHECGHVISGNLTGNASAGNSAFWDGKNAFATDAPVLSFFTASWENERTLKKGTTNEDFISGYAKTDIFEDFAETFAAYVLQRPYLKKRAETNTAIAQKLTWMEQNLPMSEEAIGKTTYAGTSKVPWDVTKLPYASLLSVR